MKINLIKVIHFQKLTNKKYLLKNKIINKSNKIKINLLLIIITLQQLS
jgi:hypothetical protein